jgi:hypothetical protein
MLDHPLVGWATEHPDDVAREVWRGIGSNRAISALEHPEVEDFARRAFRLISEGYAGYSEHEADVTFAGAMKSAETHGPITFRHMIDAGAPEAVCEGGTSLAHAARCRLSHF